MGGLLGGGSSKGAQATAGGGVSPQQAALAQYNFGQNEVFQNQQFAQTPQSTMHTQADAGALAKRAFDLAQMSDKDAKALADAVNQQAQQQQAGLGQFAEALGSQAGGGGGGSGGGGG
jgi:hypothetical protein